MRAVTREEVYQALFDFWSNTDLVVTKGRRLRMWTEVPQHEQPAVFQSQGPEQPMGNTHMLGIPPAWILNVELAVFTNSGEDLTVSPYTQMNPILDYFERLFPLSGKPETLNGLVKEVRIAPEGIKTDEGALGSQAVALVPLRILTL